MCIRDRLEVQVGILAAQVEVGLVQLEQRARIDETASERHVVAEGIGDHRADLERVALRFDEMCIRDRSRASIISSST